MVNGTVVSRADAGTATSADVHDVFGDVRWQSTTVTLPVNVDGLVNLHVGGSTIVCGADDGSSSSSTCYMVPCHLLSIWYFHHHMSLGDVLSHVSRDNSGFSNIYLVVRLW